MDLAPDADAALALAHQSIGRISAALAHGREALHARDVAVASRDMADAMAACRSLAIVTGLVLRAVSLPQPTVLQADAMFRRLGRAADTLALACRHDDWDRAGEVIGVDLPAVLTEWALLTSVIREALAPPASRAVGTGGRPKMVLDVAAGVH